MRFNESRQLSKDTIYRGLDSCLIDVSIRNYEIQISRFNFWPMLMYLCRVSFFTTLNIYKAYFKCRHIRECKENTCKRWPSVLFSLKKSYCVFCALGFCNLVFLDLHCWWSKEFCNQQSSSSWCVSYVLGSMQKGWCSYIEEFRGSEAVEGFCCKFIYKDCRV